jgi:5,5'-dehydrodivanillate O-demethylase
MLFGRHEIPEHAPWQLIATQDYVAIKGQGTVADRSKEILGKSDAGIAILRKIFLRELEAIRAGRPTKKWRALEHAADLPIQIPELAQP